MKTLLFPLLAMSLLVGCPPSGPGDEEPPTPTEDSDYTDLDFPEHWSAGTTGGHGGGSVLSADNMPDDNLTTEAGADLGRHLFYDTALSRNGTIACASCHQAELGFSDERELSLGFEGGETGRHSMGLTNARFYSPGRFFWDQRAATLEEQVLMPFQDQIEMGMTLEGLVSAVEEQDFYAAFFEAAFGDPEVSSERISLALSQFVRSMVSFGSKYDLGRAEGSSALVDFPNFTDEENLGKEIFMGTPMMPNGAGCAVCHQGEAMIATAANNNGLDGDSSIDAGYGEVTEAQGDMGTFKVPSLRNVAVRGRFMHDGRFASLREVVDHYGDSVQSHPNLGMPLSMHDLHLSESHRGALVAFLETLTDEDMLQDPKFSNPFE